MHESFTLRVIDMALTVLCCKAAAMCVAFWLLLVIKFYTARIAYCMFLTAVNPLQNLNILKPKCCAHHINEQMIALKCST